VAWLELIQCRGTARSLKHHSNVVSTIVQRANLYLSSVQAVGCSCGTKEESIQIELVQKQLVDSCVPFCLLACRTVFISVSFFLSCLTIQVFIRVKKKKFSDILL